jgi:hypothetical protein
MSSRRRSRRCEISIHGGRLMRKRESDWEVYLRSAPQHSAPVRKTAPPTPGETTRSIEVGPSEVPPAHGRTGAERRAQGHRRSDRVNNLAELKSALGPGSATEFVGNFMKMAFDEVANTEATEFTGPLTQLSLEDPTQWTIGWTTLPPIYQTAIAQGLDARYSISLMSADEATRQFSLTSISPSRFPSPTNRSFHSKASTTPPRYFMAKTSTTRRTRR